MIEKLDIYEASERVGISVEKVDARYEWRGITKNLSNFRSRLPRISPAGWPIVCRHEFYRRRTTGVSRMTYIHTPGTAYRFAVRHP